MILGNPITLGGGIGKAFAVIVVSYPEGSTCTCTDGTKTLKLKDTSGRGIFLIPYAATWTVTCTDGTKTKSESVEITTEGQSESVQLTYPYYLLKDGVFNSSLGSLEKTSYVSFSSGIINGTQDSENCAAFSFANKITIPNNAVIKMRITQSSYVTYNGTKLGFTFGISTSNSLPKYYADYFFSAQKQTNDIVSNFTEYSLDLSSFIGQSFYIKATAAANFKVNQIWFE